MKCVLWQLNKCVFVMFLYWHSLLALKVLCANIHCHCSCTFGKNRHSVELVKQCERPRANPYCVGYSKSELSRVIPYIYDYPSGVSRSFVTDLIRFDYTTTTRSFVTDLIRFDYTTTTRSFVTDLIRFDYTTTTRSFVSASSN